MEVYTFFTWYYILNYAILRFCLCEGLLHFPSERVSCRFWHLDATEQCISVAGFQLSSVLILRILSMWDMVCYYLNTRRWTEISRLVPYCMEIVSCAHTHSYVWLISPAVPVTGQHFRVPVCSHQWRWYVCNIFHHVLQITNALVVQSDILVLFHLSLHLCSDKLIHFCHHGCLWHNQGKQNNDLV
jgi:hypothetical protein